MSLLVIGTGLGASADDGDAEGPIAYRTLEAWTFPTGLPGDWMLMAERNQDNGACLELMPQESGPVIRLLPFRQKALDVTAVDIVLDRVEGSTISGMRLFWARQADYERDENWPFSNERSAPFQLVEDEEGRQLWRADIAFHGNWIGTINGMFIGATVPEEAGDSGASLCIREISLQEEVWASDGENNAGEEN